MKLLFKVRPFFGGLFSGVIFFFIAIHDYLRLFSKWVLISTVVKLDLLMHMILEVLLWHHIHIWFSIEYDEIILC